MDALLYITFISKSKSLFSCLVQILLRTIVQSPIINKIVFKAIPHNSKCRYGERGTADAKTKAQIILDAAKVSAASGGNSEPKQGQRSQSARGFCPRSTMRVPQPDIIEHFGNTDAVLQLPERCLSRKAGIVRCCLRSNRKSLASMIQPVFRPKQPEYGLYLYLELYDLLYNANAKQIV